MFLIAYTDTFMRNSSDCTCMIVCVEWRDTVCWKERGISVMANWSGRSRSSGMSGQQSYSIRTTRRPDKLYVNICSLWCRLCQYTRVRWSVFTAALLWSTKNIRRKDTRTNNTQTWSDWRKFLSMANGLSRSRECLRYDRYNVSFICYPLPKGRDKDRDTYTGIFRGTYSPLSRHHMYSWVYKCPMNTLHLT